MKKEKIIKILILIISIIGLWLHIIQGFKTYGYAIFYFFTVLSNVAVVAYYILYFIIPRKNSAIIQGYILEPILLTGILNWIILAPLSVKYYGSLLPLFNPSNFIVHGLVPILVLVDWILFAPIGIYKKIDPLKWCCFPIIYSLFIYGRALLGTPIFAGSLFPYPFYGPNDMRGWNDVILGLFRIAVIYLVCGYILYAVKREDKS
ncbi:Pr6Pr family membrane protein [Lactococcus lactis]|uniref:Pr6Pr family membrane protein n=1 Tax=Lactococcus lactis TaxID=1358 RepID=UPI001914561D|nr:Pr6Pr family membrane protein [Lactococcus lactis]MBK5077547.1 Pr6Pr family membrane protein [Lactococcus lactis]WDA67261.1 Pr6Pr family membrane protein [Lactococcus lactis]